MRKKNTVVISSSDDEDCGRPSRVKRSYEKPKSRSSFASTNPSRAKKPRISRSRSCVSKGLSNVDEVNILFLSFDFFFFFLVQSLHIFILEKWECDAWLLLLQIRLAFEDFNEVLSGFKVSSGMLMVEFIIAYIYFPTISWCCLGLKN